MKTSHISRWLLGATLVFGLQAQALAQEFGTREEAKAMVDAAVMHITKVGPDKAFADFTDKGNKDWHKKDLYLFVSDMKGVNFAHGANDKMVGKNLIDVKDPNGKFLIQDLRATAQKGGGWVEYDWPNPVTKKVESKITYVRKTEGFDGFVGAGVYR